MRKVTLLTAVLLALGLLATPTAATGDSLLSVWADIDRGQADYAITMFGFVLEQGTAVVGDTVELNLLGLLTVYGEVLAFTPYGVKVAVELSGVVEESGQVVIPYGEYSGAYGFDPAVIPESGDNEIQIWGWAKKSVAVYFAESNYPDLDYSTMRFLTRNRAFVSEDVPGHFAADLDFGGWGTAWKSVHFVVDAYGYGGWTYEQSVTLPNGIYFGSYNW